MPSLKMKRENCGLHVCQKSTIISKNLQSYSPEKFQSLIADYDKNSADECVSEIPKLVAEATELPEQKSLAHYSAKTEDMEVSPAVQSSLQLMFTPSVDASEIQCESGLHWDAGTHAISDESWADFAAKSATDNSDINAYQAQDLQTCNISDYLISDMIVTGMSVEESTSSNDDSDPSVNDSVNTNTSALFDMICHAAEPMCQGSESSHEANRGTDESCLYVSMDQLRSHNMESDTSPYLNYEQDQCTSPQWDLPCFTDSLTNCSSTTFQKTEQKRKAVTLVLDLDETLVHSSFMHRDDSDFSFQVFFENKEITVYVRERPYLRAFLEKVTEMFEIVIFTASQSIYAKQLLDILDPNGKIISRRFYRESCIFLDGCYTKDLTIIGADLAKVAIIDNTPEVFKLQVNNGIPIKSWFDDPSDSELLSLLPLLESIVDAEDVRPIIADKFGNKN